MNYKFIHNIDINELICSLSDDDVNLLLVERSLNIDPEAVEIAIGALRTPLQVWFVNEHVQDPRIKIETAIAELGGNPAQWAPITADVEALYRLFIAITSDSQPFLSLRVVDEHYFNKTISSVSSEWHRDSTALTMFVTYLGVGTQWTPDSNVKREYFVDHQIQRINDPDGLFLHDPELVLTASLYSIGLLKGELLSNERDASVHDFLSNFTAVDRGVDFNAGRGVIHRGSARVSNNVRLLLTISTFRVPMFLSKHGCDK